MSGPGCYGDAPLILAGPTMDLDGAVVLYRRANALADVSAAGGTGELLVICDLLVDVRLHDGTLIHADMFRPGPARSGQTAPPRAAR